MNSRQKPASSNNKSVTANALSASSRSSTRSHGRDDETVRNVATQKDYADSRLKQFCLR